MEDSQGDHKSYFTLEREKLESHLKAISLQISEMKLQSASPGNESDEEEEEYYNDEEEENEAEEEAKYSISPTESKAP